MFKNISFPSPKVLYISTNILKGGDCMGLEHAVSNMIWEGSPVVVRNSSFPEVRGRTRFDSALELSATGDPERPIDWSLFRSVGEMDAVTDR